MLALPEAASPKSIPLQAGLRKYFFKQTIYLLNFCKKLTQILSNRIQLVTTIGINLA